VTFRILGSRDWRLETGGHRWDKWDSGQWDTFYVSHSSHFDPCFAVTSSPFSIYNSRYMDELGGTSVPFVSYTQM